MRVIVLAGVIGTALIGIAQAQQPLSMSQATREGALCQEQLQGAHSSFDTLQRQCAMTQQDWVGYYNACTKTGIWLCGPWAILSEDSEKNAEKK